ncbi:MAG: hypothetical protein V8R01_01795 [Bacilli bacterium]
MKICRKCGCLIQYPHTYCNKCEAHHKEERETQLKELKKDTMQIIISLRGIKNIKGFTILMNGNC